MVIGRIAQPVRHIFILMIMLSKLPLKRCLELLEDTTLMTMYALTFTLPMLSFLSVQNVGRMWTQQKRAFKHFVCGRQWVEEKSFVQTAGE